MMAHLLHLLLLCYIASVRARLSGIYVDNGLDQTMIKKVLTRQDKLEVQREILNLLGLPSRPKPMGHIHLENSAPKFLMDVYKGLMDRSAFSITGDDQKAIDESDAIMSFMSQKRHVDGMRHDGSRRLWFDVSEVPVEDEIVGAELRIFQSPNASRHRHHGEEFTITVYQVVPSETGETSLQYVDALNTTLHNEGWLVFNMTGPFTTWVAIPSLNLGLYVATTPRNKPSHELRLEEIGIVPAHGHGDREPFLAAFIKSSGVREARLRQTREAKEQVRERKRKSQNSQDYSLRRHPLTPESLNNHYTSHSCQIKNLYVSFKDLKWEDWIIAPDGYQAFYCSGECNFPLNSHMNATNHAIVQTLVNLMDPSKAPKPCCAPTKLSAISVLFYIEDSNVIMKKYKNMVVKSCGCH